MARNLKVWTIHTRLTGLPREETGGSTGQVHAVVAATSQAAAAEALGVTVGHLRNYGSVTANEQDVAVASAEPGVVFWQPLNRSKGIGYRRYTPPGAETVLPDPLVEYQFSGNNWAVAHWFNREVEDPDGLSGDNVVLDAPYQRGSVWDLDRRRNLIRSLVMGLPVGSVIYAKLPFGIYEDRPAAHYRIIDGRQRIETVRAFHQGEFTVPGHWFNSEWADDDLRSRDVTYPELPQPLRSMIQHRHLPGLEFESFRYHTLNPDYDPTLRAGYGGVKRSDPRTHRYLWHDRTNDEALALEAEVFLLVNFGGVEQTDEHRAKVEGMAHP